jgi:hypothetical protein
MTESLVITRVTHSCHLIQTVRAGDGVIAGPDGEIPYRELAPSLGRISCPSGFSTSPTSKA